MARDEESIPDAYRYTPVRLRRKEKDGCRGFYQRFKSPRNCFGDIAPESPGERKQRHLWLFVDSHTLTGRQDCWELKKKCVGGE